MHNIVLNKNKNIGKVVFIVEGDKKEHTLLRYIFKDILDYSVVDVKRGQQDSFSKYVSKTNSDSRVFVVSAETSNVRSAGDEGRDYLDMIFFKLYNEYSLDINNAAVYYIFDRDNESNFYSEAEKLTKTLRNSRDNGMDVNGLLLLSYPCIEAFLKSCIDDFSDETIDSPKSLKKIVSDSRYQYNKIYENELINSCIYMLMGINRLCGRDVTDNDLDDFEEISSTVLDKENQLYLEKKQYLILSFLSVAFLDLGILEKLDN